MEALESLKLQKCDHLVGIPSLSSLKVLFITGCPSVKGVSYSPILTNVMIDGCNSFEDLSTFSHVQYVALLSCNKITSILPLQRVSKVAIRNCTEIQDLERISNPQDDYMSTKRTISLYNVSKLQNIYHLVLEGYAMEPLDLSLLGNLEIRSYCCLITTKGLGI
jgi:hypothetical protein